MKIPEAVVRKLGWYIYAYVNPLDDRVFYVGKGRGRRVLHHLGEIGAGPKARAIRTIRKAGFEPKLEILAHGIRDAETALQIEATVIDALGLEALANRVRGWRAVTSGRVPLAELVALYDKRKVTVRDPSVLIRINRLYRPGMSPTELYDATRGVWKVKRSGPNVKLAMAVFEGVVREVYEIATWLPAGSTFSTRGKHGVRSSGRLEFVGRVAPDRIRRQYVDRYVGHLLTPGSRNPITYVNVGKSPSNKALRPTAPPKNTKRLKCRG